MTPTMQAELDALLSELSLEVAPPTTAEGYGTDLVCLDDLTRTMAELDPNSVDGITQDLWHRLNTPRGLLGEEDPDYGYDLVGMLSHGATESDRQLLGAAITGECRKSDRVDDVFVTVTAPEPETLRVSIVVRPEDPAIGEFPMVFVLTKDTLPELQAA